MQHDEPDMTPQEYVEAAMRTEHTPNFILKNRGGHPPIPDEGPAIAADLRLSRMIHAMLGMMSELGELADALKKHLIYGAPLDDVNLIEENGDQDWYRALFADAMQVGLPDAWRRNIAKLKKRFPDKFTQERALNRDLDAERKALEGGVKL